MVFLVTPTISYSSEGYASSFIYVAFIYDLRLDFIVCFKNTIRITGLDVRTPLTIYR